MIISTHSVFGAVTAQAISFGNPAIAFIVGFFSHFILDAIPHWDYKLKVNSEGLSKKAVFSDAWKVLIDFLGAGILIYFFLQGEEPFSLIIWLGALGAVFPDVLQNLADFKGFRFLSFFRDIHNRFHSSKELKSAWAIIYQILLIIVLFSLEANFF
jgi:hypothetical protein